MEQYIAFYDFFPIKEGKEGSAPTFDFVFIPPGIHLNQEIDFFEQRQQNENDDPQLEDQLPPPPAWHIVKILTRSDVGHLCRLVLQHDHVASLLPLWDPVMLQNISHEGLRVRVLIKDADRGFSEHWVVFRRWSSNGLYVMQSGWRQEFVVRRGLKAGDEIGLSWNLEQSCFFFSVLRRAQ